MKKPDIRKHSKITSYLEDYFKFRKAADKSFSYDIWAAELGFKSRSFLRMLTQGQRNLTPKVTQILSQKLNFSETEKKHFSLLALSHNAKSDEHKNIYQEKILELSDTETNKYDIKDYPLFISSPSLSVLLLLISFEDVTATNAQLQKLTGQTVNELKKNLEILRKLELIRLNQNKVWLPLGQSFKIPDKAQDKALIAFHRKSLKEADRILTAQGLRRFRTIYFGIEEENWDELKNDIEVFLSKLKKKYGSISFENKRLVKLNLNAYPVSELYKK